MEQAENQNESSVILHLEAQECAGKHVQTFNPQVGALQMEQACRRNKILSKAIVLQGHRHGKRSYSKDTDMEKDPEQNGVSAKTCLFSTLEKDLV